MRVRVAEMACCWSSQDQPDKSNDYILDVEQILQDYVWNTFRNSRTSLQKLCLRRKDFLVDVPMNYFHFDKIYEDVRPRQKTLPAFAQASQHPTVAQSMTHIGRDVTQNPLTSCSHVTALSTAFTNSTDAEQTYSFRFEKTRKASVNVTFQKGFTVGGKVNFSLGLPKTTLADGKVGGELDMRINVSKATGELIEETLTWSASSDIKVTENSKYTAKVLVSEAPVSYNFEIWTKMSMPSGGAPATVKHKKSGPGDMIYTKIINNLKMVLQGYEHAVKFQPEPPVNGCSTYSAVFITKGIVDGVRLSDQKIVLDGKPLRRSSEGSVLQGSSTRSHNHDGGGGMMPLEGCGEDGYLVSSMGPPVRAERMLVLDASSNPPPPPLPPPPIIEEVPEDDGGVRGSDPPPSSSFPAHGGGGGVSHQVPHITTTSPSSLASSPLSDTGSGLDMSECSKKSQTVTTV